MLFTLLRFWQIGAGAALGAVLMFGWASALMIPNARQEGREIERAAIARAINEQNAERNRTNEEVRDLDPAELCSAIGGVLTDGKCR